MKKLTEKPPCDILKRRWDEKPNREIEQPVRDARQCHARRARFEGPYFGCVDCGRNVSSSPLALRRCAKISKQESPTPRHRRQRNRIRQHQQIAKCNNRIRRRPRHLDLHAEIPVQAFGEVFPMRPEDPAHDEEARPHGQGAVDE
jgi:hypothetical protein